MESISFDKTYIYNTLKSGITVSVILSDFRTSKDLEAKIDTGSSFCVFERKHAERLGLDVESGEHIRIATAAGNFEAYGFELEITVLEITTISKVYFAKDESFNRNILGRQGWLDRVKLGLVDYEGKLLLSSYNE